MSATDEVEITEDSLTRLLITSNGAQIVVATVPCESRVKGQTSFATAADGNTHGQKGACEVQSESVVHELAVKNHRLKHVIAWEEQSCQRPVDGDKRAASNSRRKLTGVHQHCTRNVRPNTAEQRGHAFILDDTKYSVEAANGCKHQKVNAPELRRPANAPVLVPQLFFCGLVCVASHPYENDVCWVTCDTSQASSDACCDGHLPGGERLPRDSQTLLQRVVDSETRERVGHLAQDGSGQSSVCASS